MNFLYLNNKIVEIADFRRMDVAAHHAVDPAFRGRGIARILMAEVLDRARLSRSEEVYLEVRPSNTAARQLYESLGFRQVERRRDYYSDGEDALVLSLPISA